MPTAVSPSPERDQAVDRERDGRTRVRAALLSLVVGVVLLGVKYLAYRWTGSTAVLSDALESIVNVAAASLALGSIVFARRPADADHPYGHGKIEYFSAVFEGGLVSFAAVAIAWYAIEDLLAGPELRAIELGLVLTAAAGCANAALGWYLIGTGRRIHSMALVADGQHVLSDFWTSVGVVVGLLLVRLTGLAWLDPATALVVAVHLAITGARLVREAAGGLLDEEDTAILEKLVAACEDSRTPGIIRVHRLRARRAGRFTQVDGHLIVPEFWTVERAHEEIEAFEERVLHACASEGEIVFHADPCQRALCRMCEMPECAVRAEPLTTRPPFTVDEARLTDDLFWGARGHDVRRAAAGDG